MTGHIIPLRAEPHERVRTLLPWFVTDRLDTAERAEVEAHLGGCPDCQAEARLERQLGEQVAAIPMDVEQSWADLKARLERPSVRAPRRWRGWTPSIAWALAGQAAVMALMLGVLWPRPQPASMVQARYHALSSPPPRRPGNVVAIFRPEMSERDLRLALLAARARIVDGPTATGAYVLSVPAGQRIAILGELRHRAGVVMAEPIDGADER
jgi:anti-sigma factor RsiW